MQANVQDVIEALLPLVRTLEQLGIPYYVGGSVASSYYGLFRQTQDVDLILAVRPQDIRKILLKRI